MARAAAALAGYLGVRQSRRKATSWDGETVGRSGNMANEFTAVVERDDGWFIAYCPEVPGANGQGRNKEEALESLSDAISLILEDRRADGLRGVPPDAQVEKVTLK